MEKDPSGVLLIVVGVFAALAGNSWWESRKDHEREQVYLRQLLFDVQQTERNLDAAIQQDGRSEMGARAILTALQAGGELPSDSLRAWVAMEPLRYSDPRLVTGTITALQQTGDLRLLRNDDLRAEVSAYASATAADWEEFSRWVGYAMEYSDQFLAPAVRRVQYPLGREDAHEAVFRLIVALQEDPEARVGLSGIYNAAMNRLFYLRRMREATERLEQVVRSARQ